MARTNANAVQGLLLDDYGPRADGVTLPSLTPFIETASALVDDLVSYSEDNNFTQTDARLELIERWLAAHFYVMSDQNYSYKQTSKTAANFQGKTDMFLKASKYGQSAINLDRSGYLVAISDGTVDIVEVEGFWLGKPPSAQVPYYQRD